MKAVEREARIATLEMRMNKLNMNAGVNHNIIRKVKRQLKKLK